MKNVPIIKSDVRSVLAFVRQFLPRNPLVVEAGAFCGHDTLVMSEFLPCAVIHAFEPVPQLFDQLQKKTAQVSHIFCYRYALSDNVGFVPFYLAEKPEKKGVATQAGSLLKPKERLQWSPMMYNNAISVETITLDLWAEQMKVPKIDFLWLDVQGHALSVLQAAQQILSTIKVIYVEVEFVEAYEGQALYHQVKVWLEHYGFNVKAVTFADQNSWFFGNVVFVKDD